jgi:RNA polymerase sigma-70 factor (ECF subfamily)
LDALDLAEFHAGTRPALERCYREHYADVTAAVVRVLGGVDAESVIHEVFYRLLSSAEMRMSFRGGNLGAWLARVATNAAIDCARRRGREVIEDGEHGIRDVRSGIAGSYMVDDRERVDAKLLVDRFRRNELPPEWDAVFEARFLRQLPQREAAQELGIPRSTLVYQEQRIRGMLRRFLLEDEGR